MELNLEEEWTRIKSYDYFISTYGNVENAKTGQLLKLSIDGNGYYYYVDLYKNP